MKYFIFKTLDNNNITIKIAPRNIIQLVLGNEKIAEYSKKEIIQQPPLVDVAGTTVKLNFGRDQWGREVPTQQEQ